MNNRFEGMTTKVQRSIAPIVIGLAMLACGLGSAIEPDAESQIFEDAASEPIAPQPTQAVDPGESAIENGPGAPHFVQTIPEERLLTFEWPEGIRVGDSDILRLALVLNEDGSVTPSAVFDDHEVLGQGVTIENMYETHLVRAESRLDLAGADVEPTGTVIQRLLPGQPVIFTWSISPDDTGKIRGNVWLYIRYLPKESGGGEEVEKLIFTQPLEIQAQNVLGLGGAPARILGILGIALSSLLGLDDLFKIVRRVIKI
jgi:hypothetical protein